MTAKSGEKAQESGDFRCKKCHEQVHVTQGDALPKCPNCGNNTFDKRYQEPGNKSS